MKIAYICADRGVPVFGWKGSSIHVQEVINALMGQGARIELFATRLDGEKIPGFENVRIHKLPFPEGDHAGQEKAALAANSDLRDLLKREGPFDMVYERYSLWSYAGMEYARDIGIPGVLEVNSPLIEEQAQHRTLIDPKGAQLVAMKAFGAATSLIAVSGEIVAYLGQFPATRERVHVIPNGVNSVSFPENIKPSLPRKPGIFTIGFVGSLKSWHGLSILVKAYDMVHKRDPALRLLVVGDGPQRQNLISEIINCGLMDTVHITGGVTHGEVPGLLASMDVAVAPYPHIPNFYFSPLKIYEYMAAGLPVVASCIGQVTELIQDGTNGLLYPPDDHAALAEALYRLRRDPLLCKSLGRSARETVLGNHTWDIVARKILELAGLESLQQLNTGEER